MLLRYICVKTINQGVHGFMGCDELYCSYFEVKNSLGLHARPAAMLVETVTEYEAEVFIEKDGEAVNAKSLIGLLMLSAGHGSTVKVSAEGQDAEKAMSAIAELFERKFDED